MMHTSQALYGQLHAHLLEINKQLEETIHDLQKQIAVLPYPDETTVYMMKNRDGTYALSGLLAAKAQVLSGMAALKAADGPSRPPAAGKKW